MPVEMRILALFIPLIFFVGCGLVVAAEQWWQDRNKLTDWRNHEP